jgi:hypothetical protein
MLGIDQRIIEGHFEAALIGGDERDGFDLRLKIVQQFGRQTGSPVCVVSNRAVFNRDF